ncbi:MAG TPA: lysylphosphatidylglycerol synthase transmembrane domain-containing protein [Gemmatimonadaceae bacterium]|nr:lysylphosphatidylglycerol synthase transmembrane domain-containing protein [Gemmatimonadaceae bacterium]
MTPIRWILTAVSFLATFGVSAYVIASNWPAEGAPLGLPWWAHLLCLGAWGLDIFFRVAKIHYSARAIGVPITWGTIVRTTLGGDFAAAITPSRSGAEPARFLIMSDGGTPLGGVVLVLFLEVFLEALSLFAVAGALGLLLHESTGLVRGLLGTVTLYAAGILAMGGVALTLSKRNARGPRPRWVRWIGVNALIWRRVQRGLRQLRGSVDSLREARRGTMLLALLCSILHVSARLLTLPLIVWSYGGDVAMGPLLLWPLILLYGAAVAPAPGGGGMVEVAFKVALGGTLPARLLGASLIWWRVYTFYLYTVAGAFAAGRTVMRALRRAKRHH